MKQEWIGETSALFFKEIKTEWRTRVALSGTALFAAGTLTLTGAALAGLPVRLETASAILWILLLFTASVGLGRAFVQEEERGTSLALRLHARATAVWTGKFLANLLLMLALSAVSTPVLLSILKVDLSSANPIALACVLLLGNVAVASVFTTTGALVAQSSARGGLLAALSFPVLSVALLAGVHGTQASLGVGVASTQGAFVAARGDLQILASYSVVSIAASLLLFDFVWND